MSNPFRVWCLSWDDTEEDGKDVVTSEDPLPWRLFGGSLQVRYPLDAESAAEEYAHYAHDARDGNECTWPLVFRVRGPDDSIQDFEVERNFDPTFSARRRSVS